MPFYISYTLLTGTGSRMAETAAGALVAYNELKSFKAGAITIRDETGKVVTLEELTLAAGPQKMKRDRDPDFLG